MSETQTGGSFLLGPVADSVVYIPEEMPEEYSQFRDAARDFIEGEVMPHDEAIEAKGPGVIPDLMKKAGALGFMMSEVPEAYGGASLGKVAATAIMEGMNGQGSFSVAFLCHTGIGTLPLLAYGNEDQKQKYLPGLASGEILASYALTEANSGSDALAARTRADKAEDGSHYILNGEKMFITNGGFADLFTVFAKVDGEHFSAFLVDRDMPGVSQGPEEKKMGVHGSSTVPLILENVKVPAENLLGEEGRGHKIAFNTLNVGRWKLGAGVTGAAKRLLKTTIQYITERQQFGKPLSDFELMQQKLADCVIRTFCTESIVYRYAGALDALHATVDADAPDASLERAKLTEELAIEASICKVFASEAMGDTADEAVQMFGGYGYIQEYRPERHFRDNRINRIWEGTNEINRLIIPGTIFKRTMKGQIDLLGAFQSVMGEIKNGFATAEAGAGLAPWQDITNGLKKLALYLGGVAVNAYGPDVEQKQQTLSDLADLMIAAYVADTIVARALKLQTMGNSSADLAVAMVQCYLVEQWPQLMVKARQCLTNIAGGDAEQSAPYYKALSRFIETPAFDLVGAKRRIAEAILASGEYRW